MFPISNNNTTSALCWQAVQAPESWPVWQEMTEVHLCWEMLHLFRCYCLYTVLIQPAFVYVLISLVLFVYMYIHIHQLRMEKGWQFIFGHSPKSFWDVCLWHRCTSDVNIQYITETLTRTKSAWCPLFKATQRSNILQRNVWLFNLQLQEDQRNLLHDTAAKLYGLPLLSKEERVLSG